MEEEAVGGLNGGKQKIIELGGRRQAMEDNKLGNNRRKNRENGNDNRKLAKEQNKS